MPEIFYRPLSRRSFLRVSSRALAATGLVAGCARLVTHAAPASDSLHVALLSDTHVAADPKSENRKFRPWENLQLAVDQAGAVQPRFAILNGDAARLTGEPGDYEGVKALLGPLAERCPVYIAMGNHDNRENFLKTFTAQNGSEQSVKDKHVLVIEETALRIVMLDSLLYTNKTAGLLGKVQREWLDKFLARADSRPTLVFVHHTLGDGDGELLDAEALLRIVHPYRKVKAIFYGHSHEYNYKQKDGLHLVNLPAVGYNFADKEPVGWVDAYISPTGAELTLRAFGGNREQDGKTVSLQWRG